MDLAQLLSAVDDLPPEDRQRLKDYLLRRESSPRPRTVAEWLAEFEDIAREFRGDSSDEEMEKIIQAMTLKSKPSKKGL